MPKGALANKKLFLALEKRQKDNRAGKAFNEAGWENIVKVLKETMSIQFKNIYGQLRASWKTWKCLLIETGLGYDPGAKIVMLDDDSWNEMTKII